MLSDIFKNPSLLTRIAVGKTIGLIIGLIAFISLPHVAPESSLMLRWGVLLWYITFGAIIGMFGAVTWHPMLKIPLPWWIRDPMMGSWLNFVLVFFAHDQMQYVLISFVGEDGFMQSPFWFVLEGTIIGLLIGYFAKRFGGEGYLAAKEMNK